MRTRTRIRPGGTDAATDFALTQGNRANDELQFFDSPGIGFEQTTRGVRAYLKRNIYAVTGFPWQKPNKELDPAKSVSKDTFVYISQMNPMVTDGIVDVVSGVLTMAQPGTWQAIKTVPAQVTVAGVVEYNVPAPLVAAAVTGTPLKGDADAAGLFWIRWPNTGSCF